MITSNSPNEPLKVPLFSLKDVEDKINNLRALALTAGEAAIEIANALNLETDSSYLKYKAQEQKFENYKNDPRYKSDQNFHDTVDSRITESKDLTKKYLQKKRFGRIT